MDNLGTRFLEENYGLCRCCRNSAPRVPVSELHTETETAWRCEDCEGITMEEALFRTKLSESTVVVF